MVLDYGITVSKTNPTSPTTGGGTVSSSGKASSPILFVDPELLKKRDISYEQYLEMPPEKQQEFLNELADFNIKGCYVERTENTASETEHNQAHDVEDHPQVPTKAEWKKMSFEERMNFLKSEIDFHMDELGVPEDQRQAVLDEWMDNKVRESRGISEDKWNNLKESRKQALRDKYVLSFETTVKNGYTAEDYAEMSQYTKIMDQAKVAEEKLASGAKINSADSQAIKQGRLLETLKNNETADNAVREYPNFIEKYESSFQESLAERRKDTDKYKQHEIIIKTWAEIFQQAYNEAPADKKKDIIAGLTEEQQAMFSEVLFSGYISPEQRKEMMINLGLNDGQFISLLWEQSKSGKISGENVSCAVEAIVDIQNADIERGAPPEQQRKNEENVGMCLEYDKWGLPAESQERIFDIVYENSQSSNTKDAAASSVHKMQKPAQLHATDMINKNESPEAGRHAQLALQGANDAGDKESLLNIQSGFNKADNTNEFTRTATIDFTKEIKDAELQNEFDKNNFEATEALEDKDMAIRLHQHRIDEMPNWDAKVQEQAFQRTMESKYTEVQDYAASNISKLDPTVQRSAMDAVYQARQTQNNEKVVTAALEQIEKMPAVIQQEEISRVVAEEVFSSNSEEFDEFAEKYNSDSLSQEEIAKLSASDRRKYFDAMFKKASLSDKIKMLRSISGNNAKYIFNMICRYGDAALITNMVLSEGMGAKIIKSGVAPDVRNKIISILKRNSSNESIAQINELRADDKSYIEIFDDYAFGKKETVDLKG